MPGKLPRVIVNRDAAPLHQTTESVQRTEDCTNSLTITHKGRIEGVQNAAINLISERLSLEFEGDETKILNQVAAVCKKVEPDAVLHIA